MKIQFKLYILLVTVATGLAACTESFFDLNPSNSVVGTDYFKTADDYNLAVVGCYAKLQGQVNYYVECCEYRSDNLYLSAPTTGTQDRYDIDQFKETAANGILQNYWANFYNGVFRCNTVLDRIDDATFEETLRNQYKGEALFIRALTYFNLYRTWGGVQTTKTVVTPAEALSVKRSSAGEMYTCITEDLQEIISYNLLPETYNAENTGRATIGAAMALLGKVYLTFHEWEKARDILVPLIGRYRLTQLPGDVFDVDNKMNAEVIFAIRFNKSVPGEGHSFWHTTSNPNDPTSQSSALAACYTDDDLRKELISYVASGSTYVIKKFYDTEDTSTKTVGNDQILLRYADVLLMYAEALNEISYDATPGSPALQALNEVRIRAGLAELTQANLSTQAIFRKAVLDERQKEFPYEGHRWFDLVRMGYAKEVMAQQGHLLQDYQLLYPIPSSELERINNTELLWQNPGY